jgi:hypothetical protein
MIITESLFVDAFRDAEQIDFILKVVSVESPFERTMPLTGKLFAADMLSTLRVLGPAAVRPMEFAVMFVSEVSVEAQFQSTKRWRQSHVECRWGK